MTLALVERISISKGTMCKKTLATISTATLLSAAAACSSNSSHGSNATNDDASTSNGNDAGGTGLDAAVPAKDGGTTTTDGAANDAGAPLAANAGPPACTSPTAFAQARTTPPAIRAYQGVCSASSIQAYIAACGSMGSATACTNWQQANRPGEEDGGAGTACGQCMFPALNGAGMDPGTGATIRSSGGFSYNIGACIAVEDPTSGGSACEVADENLSSCETFACQTCTGTDLTLCEDYAESGDGVCGTETAAANSLCIDAAYSAYLLCNPGGDSTIAFITNAICGSADAGTPLAADAGPPACASPTAFTQARTTPPAIKAYQGVCSASSIQAYIAACGSMGSATACTDWQQANRPGEEDGGGGAGTACGQCMFPALNDAGVDPGTGATIRSSGHFGYNVGACIAVEDPTNGGNACDVAEQNVGSCERFACQTCTGTDLTLCQDYARSGDGVCGTEAAATSSLCIDAAYSAFLTCNPGGDSTIAFIANAICGSADAGTGMDAATTD